MAQERPPRERHLVSITSILIFSAFLIGMAVGNVLGTELEPYVLLCGLSGFLAFIGLELAAFRRKMQAIEDGKRHMENRLERHVMPRSNPGFTLPAAANESAQRERVAG